MAGNYLCLIVRPQAISLSVLHPGKPLQTFTAPLPDSVIQNGRISAPKALEAGLRQLIRAHSIPRYPCLLVLSSPFLVRRQLEMPAMDPKALPQALAFAFRDWIDLPSAALYAYSSTGIREDSQELSVCAVSASVVDTLCQCVNRAGLLLHAVIPEDAPWRSLLADCAESQICLMDSQNVLHIFSRGQPVLRREPDPFCTDPAADIRRTINLFNFTLPSQSPPITRIYLAEPDSLTVPGIQTLPLSQILPDFAGCTDSMLAIGAAQWVKSGCRTLNFLRDRKAFRPGTVAVLATLLCLILILLVHIGILMPLEVHTQAATELANTHQQLASVTEALARYEEVEQDYLRLGQHLLTEAELAQVSRTQVLALIRQQIAPQAGISDLILNGNHMTMYLSGITLEQAGSMMESLESCAPVDRASVISATADTGNEARILISVILTNQED